MPAKVILDQPTFKALAAESRIQILKLLKQRRHMQSELADSLGLAVPTVKEHLDAMEKAGLVSRIDEGRKWKYYELAQKGRVILEPEETEHQLWIVLGLFILAAVGGITGWVKGILAPYYAGTQFAASQEVAPLAMKAGQDAAALAIPATIEPVTLAANPWFWAYAGMLALLVLALAYVYWKRFKALKAREIAFRD